MSTKFISSNEKIETSKYIASIWEYRRLSWALAIGEYKNKASKNISGIFFNMIQILVGLCVYWLIFGITIGIDTKNIPYPLFVLPGIFIWHYFSYVTGNCVNCLFENQNLIGKLYFPRINIAISKLLGGLFDLIIGFIIFAILFFAYKQALTINCIAFPFVIIALIICSFGIGLWSSILSLFSMDAGKIMIQLTNFLIFITPVFYPGSIIPENFKWLMFINPMASIIEYSRWSLLGSTLPESYYLIGIAIAVVLCVTGFFAYKNLEKKITDLL